MISSSAPGPGRGPLVHRQVRRRAAALLALAGGLDLLSGLTPPLGRRLHALVSIVPLAVPQVAASLVVLAGLSLLLLSRGVRHGQRTAWQLAGFLLAASVVLHLVKGVDVEEAAAAAAVLGYLVWHSSSFAGRSDLPSQRLALATVAVAIVMGVGIGAAMIDWRTSLGLGTAVAAAAQALVGVDVAEVPRRLAEFLDPPLSALGLGAVVTAGWLLSRPVVVRRRREVIEARATEIVAQHGHDTLAYFALRDDKEHFVWGDTLVAYAVLGGVCLVSPDPIGPAEQRSDAWLAFREHADRSGWGVAVMGAGEPWLPVYRAAGMRELYIGDEAVVDLRSFSIEDGRRTKGLRKARNRMLNHGYSVSFSDPAALDPALREQLVELMTKSRRGAAERGFSMTLGRAFDPADRGLLLAVARGPDGLPAAFCQFVPAPGIGGWSLDLMRRDDGEHPNGLLDLVIVETIRHLQEQGCTGLALNFATMRAVLAGERAEGSVGDLQRWVLQRLSGAMQIESLWRYSAKFWPEWRPRYAVYETLEQLVPAALAVARAESFSELPVVGRFFVAPAAS